MSGGVCLKMWWKRETLKSSLYTSFSTSCQQWFPLSFRTLFAYHEFSVMWRRQQLLNHALFSCEIEYVRCVCERVCIMFKCLKPQLWWNSSMQTRRTSRRENKSVFFSRFDARTTIISLVKHCTATRPHTSMHRTSFLVTPFLSQFLSLLVTDLIN